MNNSKRYHKSHQQFLERLSELIISSMASGQVSIESLASKMYISRGQLTRRVKAITGLTTQQYAMQIRLDKASELLSSQEYSIYDIAFKCGFEDPTSFSRAFRRKYGIPPSVYRNNISYNINEIDI